MRLAMIKHIVNIIVFLVIFTAPCARANSEQAEPFPPFKIANHLYFVGNKNQATYLVVTEKGNILINADYEVNLPLIKNSIKKLGFNYNDIKIILLSHAHSDHAAASALIKKETKADYMVMDQDVSVIESGGKTDFHYARDPEQIYPAAKVNRVLHDGDEVKLGNTILTAHLTPGHTKGCTTWTMKAREGNKTYNVVIIGSVGVNPGYKLIHNSTYPEIAEDYRRAFQVLKKLPCDIFLGSHGMFFDLEQKYARMKKESKNPFVDPDGYRKYVLKKEREFYNELDKQKI
jgi:metallo-beta-lactamase class B